MVSERGLFVLIELTYLKGSCRITTMNLSSLRCTTGVTDKTAPSLPISGLLRTFTTQIHSSRAIEVINEVFHNTPWLTEPAGTKDIAYIKLRILRRGTVREYFGYLLDAKTTGREPIVPESVRYSPLLRRIGLTRNQIR